MGRRSPASDRTTRRPDAPRPLIDSAGPEEDRPIDLNALVSPNLGLAVVVLSVVLVVTVVVLFLQNRRVAALETRLLRLTRGSDGGNLQDVLELHLDTVDRVVDELDELAARSAVLESKSQRSLQRLGFVRFNPFEDTGSNQSFVLALLDGRDDGVVISSLHTRSSTRVYAKSVTGGRADGALSAEESQALELAAAAQPADAQTAAGSRALGVRRTDWLASPAAAPAAAAGDLQPEGRERRSV